MMKVDMIMILQMMMILGKCKISLERKGFDDHAHDYRYHGELQHLGASMKLKELEIQELRDDDLDYCHHPHLDAAIELKELESLE